MVTYHPSQLASLLVPPSIQVEKLAVRIPFVPLFSSPSKFCVYVKPELEMFLKLVGMALTVTEVEELAVP
jgi:hypothetical protein